MAKINGKLLYSPNFFYHQLIDEAILKQLFIEKEKKRKSFIIGVLSIESQAKKKVTHSSTQANPSSSIYHQLKNRWFFAEL